MPSDHELTQSIALEPRLRTALVVAVLLAIVPPLTYAMVSLGYLGAHAAFVAELQAGRLSKYIYTHEKMWRYQKVRLAEILELDDAQLSVTGLSIYDADGKQVLAVGLRPGTLSLTRRAPLVSAGRQVGWTDVSLPLTHLALEVLTLSILSTLFGISAYFARARPLHSLNRAITQLEDFSHDLKTRTAQLYEAQSLGRIGDWSYGFGDRTLWWSDEIYRLLGYDRASFVPRYTAVMAIYAEDGAEQLIQSQKQARKTGAVSTVDLKVRRGDGTIGQFAITTKTRYDDTGKATGIYGTIQDITDRKEAEAQLEQLAYHDPLTGLANRALFQRHLDDMIGRCARSGSGGALLLLDLDRFKDVNDTMGHTIGDALLVKIAHLLARTLGHDHFIARLGGDEFAIVVECGAGGPDVESIAASVLESISGTVFLEQVEIAIGTSIGIARVLEHGAGVTELLRNADLALYRAKEEGRGRSVMFEPGMDDAVQQKVAFANELRTALHEDAGLSLHYQPQIDLASGRVTGFEALIRWTHPTLGNIPPSVFIPIAESSHLICDIGSWVLRHAVVQAKAWLDAGAPPREMAVNISVAQLWSTDLVNDVGRVLAETGYPPELLCLELTESLLVDQEETRVRSVLKALKQHGVVLALDDFGTGFSSLGYLTQLPFDKLKIDRIFIDGVTASGRRTELLRGIIGLGRGLGMTTVAEGAETPEEVELLRELGCDVVQGFVYARPSPAPEALTFALRQDAAALSAPQTAPSQPVSPRRAHG
ncbi:GGDEF and EAL domain-containing protein [Hoeflea sp. BAL378]|uniref:putative bifunctional diguanylate cyclase/phosphodiesterase n=1 Tax=Hoeflea sp. BAL378 TaxID=1547437 RepID=UPI0009E05E0C|nr:GGDEF and EAL domain-containing protein [Hoeflea sp. BAL378]